MWYFSWILGVLLACAFGIINALWLEAQEGVDQDAMILDPLTKLPDRVEFLSDLATFMEAEQEKFALLMISLNAYHPLVRKQLSEKLDRMIVGLANIIRKEIRQTDPIARYDAATFIVMLPGSPDNVTRSIAERICGNAEEELDHPFGDSVVSIGIAEFPAHAGSTEDAIEDRVAAMLQTVDQAMKQAQRQGANRYHYAEVARTEVQPA